MIEYICLILMIIAFVGAFLSFHPEWKPEDKTLGMVWDHFSNLLNMTILFTIAFIILFTLG